MVKTSRLSTIKACIRLLQTKHDLGVGIFLDEIPEPLNNVASQFMIGRSLLAKNGKPMINSSDLEEFINYLYGIEKTH